MNRFFPVAMACASMFLNVGYSYAGLFAGGGGESRTITYITPPTVFNNARNRMVLTGRFSNKQSRDRRVVIYPARLPTPFPVPVSHWGSRKIQVTLPAHLAPGTYYIYLERNFGRHGRHQWRAISNKKTFEIQAEQTMGQIRGRYESSICNTPPQRLIISGGPFKSGGRHPQALNIHAEIQAPVHTSSLLPTIRVQSNTTIMALVPPCLATHRDTKLRLVYPNGTKSNWIPIEQMWAR